jgi:hypothetical protein
MIVIISPTHRQKEVGMHRQRWDFLLLVTLAATAATPASGQEVAPAVSRSVTQDAASIPDFSGIWSHPYVPGFELPRSGPGPVVNKSRRRQFVDADGRPLSAANAPFVSDNRSFVGDYTNPILKPEAAEVVKKHGEISLMGITYPTASNQCWPGPVPYIFWSFGMQMLQQSDRITILYDQDHEVRHVRMNEPHPAQLTPSWYGDSAGHYEGGTLVIDTVGIRTERPFAMIDWYGTPYTKALHVVERYRLIDYEDAKEGLERDAKENQPFPGIRDRNCGGKYLQLQFTVDDDGVFTMPWSATITYGRGRADWPESVCAENPQFYPGKDAAVPRTDKPDF